MGCNIVATQLGNRFCARNIIFSHGVGWYNKVVCVQVEVVAPEHASRYTFSAASIAWMASIPS